MGIKSYVICPWAGFLLIEYVAWDVMRFDAEKKSRLNFGSFFCTRHQNVQSDLNLIQCSLVCSVVCVCFFFFEEKRRKATGSKFVVNVPRFGRRRRRVFFMPLHALT